ncbi:MULTISPECIES: endonuclease domain-containing protein [unclassified Streptomyces]|uniref:endonuclease domain-containing protein n=1 Tax=unclassified Streptomyces TaxID=2593676 RepID=UPI003830891E
MNVGAVRDGADSTRTGVRAIRPAAPEVHVDHCHQAGRVRDVLCFNCNSAIGPSGDDPGGRVGPSHTWRETRGSQHS